MLSHCNIPTASSSVHVLTGYVDGDSSADEEDKYDDDDDEDNDATDGVPVVEDVNV